jgi:hypothetical protein
MLPVERVRMEVDKRARCDGSAALPARELRLVLSRHYKDWALFYAVNGRA